VALALAVSLTDPDFAADFKSLNQAPNFVHDAVCGIIRS
jgi:hypothetical protein